MNAVAAPSLPKAWERFWFAPGNAVNVAVARVLVSATALWMLLSRDLPALFGVPREFWAAVPRLFQWHYLLFPGHESLERLLLWTAVAALIASGAGIWPRISGLIAGVLVWHFAPLEGFLWSAGAFTWSIPILGLFFLAAAPATHIISSSRNAGPDAEPWQFGWPLQLIKVQLCFLYLFSAYSKLWESGLSWAAPAHMQAWLLGMYQRESPVFTYLPPRVAAHPLACGAMGVAALLFELSFPLVLFSRKARMILIPAAFAMHLGIVFVLNITIQYFPVLLVFVDWSSLAARYRRRDEIYSKATSH